MGYLRRNDLDEWYLSFKHNKTDFPEDSSTASVSWTAFTQWPSNMAGVKLNKNIMMTRRLAQINWGGVYLGGL
jgi:hypothetical protein